MTLEDDLRLTLRDRAAETPEPQPDLLAGVTNGVRRANRRRAATAGAAVVLAAVVALPVVLAGDRTARPTPPAQSAGPSAGSVVWVAPQLELPAFPLTPGWKPPGIGTGAVSRLGNNVQLMYEDSGVLQVEVGPVPGDWESEGEEDHRSTVGDRPAIVRTSDEFDGKEPGEWYVGVRWQLPDGQWVQLISFGPRTEAQVMRFARSLRPQTMPAAPAPFTFAEVPDGLTLQHLVGGQMCLAPRQLTATDGWHGLCVSVDTEIEPLSPHPDAEHLDVGGRPATIFDNEVFAELRVDLGNRRVLTIQRNDVVRLTREELVRFAEGIKVVG